MTVRAARHADLETLTRELVATVANHLRSALAARGTASLVVSGGKSPLRFFDALSSTTLDWDRVCVALADERWVDVADPASNEALVRKHLLQNAAATARFSGLKNGAPTPDLGAVSAWETFARVPRPFDVVLLGMGDDGHTASLFPHSPNLASALNPSAVAGCVGMQAPSAPQARMSLNWSALTDARRIILLLTGEQKWQTYLAASGPGPVEAMPVRSVLRQERVPVEVVWSP